MIPIERQQRILSSLQKKKVVSISELVTELNVSHMTIRRDIAKLEKLRSIISVSGGVTLIEPIRSEPSHDIKSNQHRTEKLNIARYAAELISDNATVYLDAGTTTLEIAHKIAHRDDLLVITNDFVITAFMIEHSTCQLFHTGGKLDRLNRSSVGEKTAKFLADFNIDQAFISTSSWDIRGISTPNEDKVVVKQSITKSSKKNYLVSDSSKFGKIAPFFATDIKCFDQIITDSHFPLSCVEELAQQGVDVIITN
ncbi:DeoR/GlpR family DNA-binding transcription regulator [Vibrio sp. S12_S33]|uniref:DeoR/GlpR family DNA-binding transcription regulator n=1 Tax=Vibrio sp. S12_S33 TaxID=2720223 RepID=UPI00177F11C6|nr:DeoR/GlpR family DNA-binding transcription regulator [Vibrio sp. S12_S33]MBD1566184.1 DeoR/GlpR transcriptional regulator [Vibrio sp. S12_S33]